MGIEKAADLDLKKDTKIVGTSFDISSVQKQSKVIESVSKKEADDAKTKMEEQYSFLSGNEVLSQDKVNFMAERVQSIINDIKAGKLQIDEVYDGNPFFYSLTGSYIKAKHKSGVLDNDIMENYKYAWTKEDTTYVNDLYKKSINSGIVVKKTLQEVKEAQKKDKEALRIAKVKWLKNDIKADKQSIESDYVSTPFYLVGDTIYAHISGHIDYDYMAGPAADKVPSWYRADLNKYTRTQDDVDAMNKLYNGSTPYQIKAA